jgi:hypothetical protein
MKFFTMATAVMSFLATKTNGFYSNNVAPVAVFPLESSYGHNANQPNEACDFSTTHTKTNATADLHSDNTSEIDYSLVIAATVAVAAVAVMNANKKDASPISLEVCTVADVDKRMLNHLMSSGCTLAGLSCLPHNNINEAKKNTVYIDPDTKMYFIREKGIVYKGFIDAPKVTPEHTAVSAPADVIAKAMKSSRRKTFTSRFEAQQNLAAVQAASVTVTPALSLAASVSR